MALFRYNMLCLVAVLVCQGTTGVPIQGASPLPATAPTTTHHHLLTTTTTKPSSIGLLGHPGEHNDTLSRDQDKASYDNNNNSNYNNNILLTSSNKAERDNEIGKELEASNGNQVGKHDVPTSSEVAPMEGDFASAAGTLSATNASAEDMGYDRLVNETEVILDTSPHTESPRPPMKSKVSSLNGCDPSECNQYMIEVTIDPPIEFANNSIQRASGLPLQLKCKVKSSRHEELPPPQFDITWMLPNSTHKPSAILNFNAIQEKDIGYYKCIATPPKCCAQTPLKSATFHIDVYQISDFWGHMVLVFVLASIVVLIGVFLYSQKKKKYHSWLKHQILAASTESTPRSTLNRDSTGSNDTKASAK